MSVLNICPPCRQPISSKEWAAFTPSLRLEAGTSSSDSATEIPGISLIHLVDTCTAIPGDKLMFTAWILNATTETLTDVTLVMRSFTNPSLEQLQYDTQPMDRLLKARTLGPRQSLQYSFTYRITARDADEPGLLISALSAELTTATMGRLSSECDATVSVVA